MVTYSQISNPMPAGNITFASDIIFDGSEGTITHTGGYIKLDNGTTPRNTTFNTDTTVDQAGGDVYYTASMAFGKWIMEEGSTLQFSGSNETYQMRIGYIRGYQIRLNGTAAKHVTIKGIDSTHRILNIYWWYSNLTARYFDVDNTKQYIDDIYYGTGCVNPAYFYNCYIRAGLFSAWSSYSIYDTCTFEFESGWDTAKLGIIYHANMVFIDCTFTDCLGTNYGLANQYPYYSSVVFLNCTNTPDFSTAAVTCSVGYFTRLDVSKVTVNVKDDSAANIQGAVVSISFPKATYDSYIYGDSYWNIVFQGREDIKNKFWLGDQTRLTDASGNATFYLLRRIYHQSSVAAYNKTLDISDSGGAGDSNDKYHFAYSKTGYITEEEDLYVGSGQALNKTLSLTTTFTDILDALDPGMMKPKRRFKE